MLVSASRRNNLSPISTRCGRGGFREKFAIARTRSPARETRALPIYFANSYRYSTNDITAPSKPWTFGFVDSMT